MIIKKYFQKNDTITFTVDGKPPQKSQWGTKYAYLVVKLRDAALKAREKAGFDQCFTTLIKLNITIYAPNIDDTSYVQNGPDDPKLYVGDLDSSVSGICDYLHRGPKKGENNFTPSPLFDDKPEIRPEIPLIIDDDSKITSIVAEKKTSKQTYYVVKIELI